jgi:hypothetical protein
VPEGVLITKGKGMDIMIGHAAHKPTLIASLTRNVLVLVAYWVAGLGLIQAGYALSDSWVAPKSGELIAAVVALVIARRLDARVAMYFAAAAAVYSATGLLIHGLFGIRAAQGAPVHLAVIAAAAMGVLLGSAVPRFRRTDISTAA